MSEHPEHQSKQERTSAALSDVTEQKDLGDKPEPLGQTREEAKGNPAYRVEANMFEEYAQCHAGRTFDVIGPGGYALGTSYINPEDAQDMAARAGET